MHPMERFTTGNPKADPEPCIDQNVTGSITVRDNGSFGGRCFTVAINGLNCM